MLGYLAIFATAAVVTGVTTPLVARLARRIRAIDVPADPRKVHTGPVPTLGGLGMIAGFFAALGVAWFIPDLRLLFDRTSEPLGLLLGVTTIAIVGVADDLRGLPPTVKLAGQIVAAVVTAFFGIQLVYAWVPSFDVVALAPDLGLPLTVIAFVAMINAVNLIDGLDGLAAGVVGIAAVAFFVFAVFGAGRGISESIPTSAPVVAAALVGMCAGFLIHNWHPASIFMGDTGSMTLGLLIAAAGVSYVGRSTAPGNADFAGAAPLLTPALILAVPLVDTGFAVIRRTVRGQPLMLADKGHLHHLLITFGHSHRRAVLTLYYWSVVVAYATVAPLVTDLRTVATVASAGIAAGVVLTVVGIWRGRRELARVGPVAPRLERPSA